MRYRNQNWPVAQLSIFRTGHLVARLAAMFAQAGNCQNWVSFTRLSAIDMKLVRKLACCMVLLSSAAPALADVRTAAFTSASDRPLSQNSIFVGATFRIGFDRKPRELNYRAALGVARVAHNLNSSELHIGEGLGLSLDRKGKPALFMAGSDVSGLWQTAKLSGGGKIAVIVVGTAAVLGITALVVVDSARCKDEGNSCD